MTKNEQMSRVRSRDTGPEMLVRRLFHASGVRYRLHDRRFPGKPDLYIPRLRLAVFVHGCFWHGHTCSRGARPKTNADFWNAKIDRNTARDREVMRALRAAGVAVLVLWTCKVSAFATVCAHVARRYCTFSKARSIYSPDVRTIQAVPLMSEPRLNGPNVRESTVASDVCGREIGL